MDIGAQQDVLHGEPDHRIVDVGDLSRHRQTDIARPEQPPQELHVLVSFR